MTQTTYLSDRELAARYGVTCVSIWRWTQIGRLPKPVRLGHNTTRWRSDEIEAFEEQKAAERDA